MLARIRSGSVLWQITTMSRWTACRMRSWEGVFRWDRAIFRIRSSSRKASSLDVEEQKECHNRRHPLDGLTSNSTTELPVGGTVDFSGPLLLHSGSPHLEYASIDCSPDLAKGHSIRWRFWLPDSSQVFRVWGTATEAGDSANLIVAF